MSQVETEEETVFGIAIHDPDILKATQFVLVSVGITAFFLIVDLSHVAEERGLEGLSKFEAVWWIIDSVKSALLVITGYIGVKRSRRNLLIVFCGISVASCLEAMVVAIRGVVKHVEAGMIAMQLFTAVFFAASTYCSFFLQDQAGAGTLLGPRQDVPSKGSYTVLGIAITMDLKVLKATQNVFTSLGISIGIFGTTVVIGAESAIDDRSFRTFWVACLCLIVSMTYTGYCGVKYSKASLLTCFSAINAVLCCLSCVTAAFVVLLCGFKCTSLAVFWIGATMVFFSAMKNATFLKEKADAKCLTTVANTEESQAPTAATVGVPECMCEDKDTVEKHVESA